MNTDTTELISTTNPKPKEPQVITYRTFGPAVIRVPGRRPAKTCHAQGKHFICTRPDGHGGRHALIFWGMGGAVRAVWEPGEGNPERRG